MTEVWNAYDLNRNQLPHLLVRGEKIPEGQFHLCVNVLVRHQDGEILIMRRSANKSLYPGYYEFGAGGSVLAGEDSIRLLEQVCSVEDQCHFDFYEAVVSGDKNQVRYQAGETDAHLWLPLSEIPAFIESHPCFQNQKRILQRWIG